MPLERDPDDAEAGDIPGVPRPRETRTLLGHAAAEAAFAQAISERRLHHAWIIGGPPGIGKATLAYRVARRMLADADPTDAGAGSLAVDPDRPGAARVAGQVAALSHPNLVALRRHRPPGAKQLPTRISVDAVRQALDLFASTAGTAAYRICIVDSAEELNANGANALLKVLEEPPARALFLIVSHAPGRLLPTIRSRCRMVGLRPLASQDVARVLAGLPDRAGARGGEAMARASDLSEGSVARALALLDPRTAEVVAEVDALLAQGPAFDRRRVLALAERLAGREGEALFTLALDRVARVLGDEIGRRTHERPARLVALADAADGIGLRAREATLYNLDRRPVVLSAFGEAARAAPGLRPARLRRGRPRATRRPQQRSEAIFRDH